jgi:2-polyprenyl-6-methoxyphenol hydroxylase-like FAD-dependent oxidoreductase
MNVLISGAGIAGPALAFWLTRRGLRPVVVERAPALRVGGHAIDIRGVAVDVVEQMGLMAAVRAARTRIRTLSVVRGNGKRPIVIDVPRARPCGSSPCSSASASASEASSREHRARST